MSRVGGAKGDGKNPKKAAGSVWLPTQGLIS